MGGMFETKVDGAKLIVCVSEPILPSHPSVRGSCLGTTFDRNGFPRHRIIWCCYTLLQVWKLLDMLDMLPRVAPVRLSRYTRSVVEEYGGWMLISLVNLSNPLSV